ncbi:hypothetical protein NHX12_033009 [Muraenolepis orangiensis]|uniref:Uncharacterized protein n=1 Tax=Muraenolepis orangiensis TaxID=630683 RepID=A0A9Q0E2L5_9TELE|nr:hypothetical protein NHX12_033009 [Muraenolepis orangiensis]
MRRRRGEEGKRGGEERGVDEDTLETAKASNKEEKRGGEERDERREEKMDERRKQAMRRRGEKMRGKEWINKTE